MLRSLLGAVLAVSALAGCDGVFGLTGGNQGGADAAPVPGSTDAMIDAAIGDGLIAWYPMDTLGPNRTVFDATGNGHDATCALGCPAVASGVVGAGAYSFDGVTQALSIPGSPDFELPLGFTQTEWVQVRSYDGRPVACAVNKVLKTNSQDNSWQGCIHDPPGGGHVGFMTTGNGPDELLSNVSLTQSTWYHVALVWNGEFKAIYINGEPDATDKVDKVEFEGGSVGIGADFDPNIVAGLNGFLDDVRIYNRALDDDEIKQLYDLRPL